MVTTTSVCFTVVSLWLWFVRVVLWLGGMRLVLIVGLSVLQELLRGWVLYSGEIFYAVMQPVLSIMSPTGAFQMVLKVTTLVLLVFVSVVNWRHVSLILARVLKVCPCR